MRINEIIREKRRALGLTQEQAAERLGVTASAVNKWERGASLPDITLLPALARLLGVDLNTLLDFSEELTDAQIGGFVNSLDGMARSEGYDRAFRRAAEKIREYPSCEKLLLSAAYYLDGALVLCGVEDAGEYRRTLDGWYEQLLESADGEIREAALVMVLARCRQEGELERAEALIKALPRPQIDRREQLALLYTAQGRADEARGIWQSRALEGITEAVTAMTHLMEDAFKRGRTEDAELIAGVVEAVSGRLQARPDGGRGAHRRRCGGRSRRGGAAGVDGPFRPAGARGAPRRRGGARRADGAHEALARHALGAAGQPDIRSPLRRRRERSHGPAEGAARAQGARRRGLLI